MFIVTHICATQKLVFRKNVFCSKVCGAKASFSRSLKHPINCKVNCDAQLTFEKRGATTAAAAAATYPVIYRLTVCHKQIDLSSAISQFTVSCHRQLGRQVGRQVGTQVGRKVGRQVRRQVGRYNKQCDQMLE